MIMIFQNFIKEIVKAHHIYLLGKGRSGLIISAFANRLMHLGFSVSLVGEITSPHSKSGDLLIIGRDQVKRQVLCLLLKQQKMNR